MRGLLLRFQSVSLRALCHLNLLAVGVAQAWREQEAFFLTFVGAARLADGERLMLEFAAPSEWPRSEQHGQKISLGKESPSMAKRKRASHEKPFSRPMPKTEESQKSEAGADVAVADVRTDTPDTNVADCFVGQWNCLISTTNWEKGQIICEWRDALIAAGDAVTEYSDEAWAQLVGGVTSQHVGRLRRVHQRFGDVSTQYEGLHWSHFQASLDWDDAEMWLEGSIQNKWSVSQMRGKRWETVGTTPEEQTAEVALAAAEQQTEAQAEEAQAQSASSPGDGDQEAPEDSDSLTPNTAELNGSSANGNASELPSAGGGASTESQPAEQVNKRTRLSVDVESLPDDLAEAFESFKLAIIAHRRENWRDTTPESVVECLDSLRQLAMADADS